MMPGKSNMIVSNNVVSTQESRAISDDRQDALKNLQDDDFKNMLDSAAKPCYRIAFDSPSNIARNGAGLDSSNANDENDKSYTKTSKNNKNKNDCLASEDRDELSSKASLILNNIREQAEESKAAADAESEANWTNNRNTLSKCASQDWPSLYRPPGGALLARTRSGPEVRIEETPQYFAKFCHPDSKKNVTDTALPYIDQDEEQKMTAANAHYLPNSDNVPDVNVRITTNQFKMVEPANKDIEMTALNEYQHRQNPLLSDYDLVDHAPSVNTTNNTVHFFKQRPKSKTGSYDVSSDVEQISPKQVFSVYTPNQPIATRTGGVHSPPSEREMTVSKHRLGSNSSVTARGIRPARLDIGRPKKNIVDKTVKEVTLAEKVPGYIGDLPVEKIMTMIEGPNSKPPSGKKKGSLIAISDKKGTPRSNDSSRSLDEQTILTVNTNTTTTITNNNNNNSVPIAMDNQNDSEPGTGSYASADEGMASAVQSPINQNKTNNDTDREEPWLSNGQRRQEVDFSDNKTKKMSTDRGDTDLKTVCSFDLTDGALYLKDDEPLPETFTSTISDVQNNNNNNNNNDNNNNDNNNNFQTVNDEAEFIPVQTKKKKDQLNRQQREQQKSQNQQNLLLSYRHSYDSQCRTNNNSMVGQQMDGKNNISNVKTNVKSNKFEDCDHEVAPPPRVRRNSANQVPVDTTLSTEDGHQSNKTVNCSHSLASPKAPSEPDRTGYTNTNNNNNNNNNCNSGTNSGICRQSYSSVTKKKRPTGHRLGEFIMDDQQAVQRKQNAGAAVKKGRNAGSLQTSRTGSPDQQQQHQRGGGRYVATHRGHIDQHPIVHSQHHNEGGRHTAATCTKSNASSPNLSLCVANYPSLSHHNHQDHLQNHNHNQDAQASIDCNLNSRRRTWADIAAKCSSSKSMSPAIQQNNHSPPSVGEQEKPAETGNLSEDVHLSQMPSKRQLVYGQNFTAASSNSSTFPTTTTTTTATAIDTVSIEMDNCDENVDKSKICRENADIISVNSTITVTMTTTSSADPFPSISEVEEEATILLGEMSTPDNGSINNNNNTSEESRFNFVIKPGEINNDDVGTAALDDITFFYDPNEPTNLTNAEDSSVLIAQQESSPDENLSFDEQQQSADVVDEEEEDVVCTKTEGFVWKVGNLEMLFREAENEQFSGVDMTQLSVRHARMVQGSETLWNSFCKDSSPVRYKDVLSGRGTTAGHATGRQCSNVLDS